MSGPMRGVRARVACLSLLPLLGVAGAAAAQDDYYRGKIIRIVVGYTAGGGFDTYSRAIARHLARHVPGKPAVIVENMPGAAGLVAANSIYRAGRPDGLTIVNFQGTQVMGQILGREGVEFDARKFEWIGAPTRENAVCALTRASGITSAQQWAASKTTVSRLYAMPPATPADRVRTLRAAFLETLRDPEFVNDAKQAKLDIDPVGGEEVERLMGELFRMPPPVLAKLKELLR